MQSVIMLSGAFYYYNAECHNAELCHAECHNVSVVAPNTLAYFASL
jgi:hypothetical protein